MLAVLRYTDCMGDEKRVFYDLAESDVEIVKVTVREAVHPRITIRVSDVTELNKLLLTLNTHTIYGVLVIKTKIENKGLVTRIASLFSKN